jgi:hypothetical protein
MSRDTKLPQCPSGAEYRYAWGNKIVHGCHRHANAMAALANVIGAQFHAEVDFDGLGVLQCEHRDDLAPVTVAKDEVINNG